MSCLKSAPQNSLSPACDQRGKTTPVKKKDKDRIFIHINKYNPAVHHYRREMLQIDCTCLQMLK